ncbi:protein TSSC4 [Electrophorus electricus]|uniref:protein TSSC4 n=1 Tax=Electrophorus electricus TaxID=8005 RepID=UPI0015CFCB60|nr:protein TSSC4 [Electrophorus electricus]XP_026873463.2 protein TSSC4 [Electrophorus electricus]XP_026873464.2 protein TSSC4 [Electrophorus electricus]XP_026873465.2 protein TSSC4 [Electrophorus electricus]XP_026873466.2 protein TSSC4 [Electrophorus electricus]XP_035376595.1 protein TSSC4 [Electrophorus electricus]XP_035376596.1 protein TSSC4 [Electrophorus electricus]
MSDSKGEGDAPNSLSNRDTINVPDDCSLTDSDPDELSETFGRKVEDLSSSSEEEEEVRPANPILQGKPAFRLTGGSSGFSDRSRSIFDQLDSAAKLTSTRLAEDNVLDGAFARPAPPSPPPAPLRYSAASEGAKKVMSGKRVPDYLAHPERWTRYSLEDIPETGEQENKQVALQFIQGLQERRRSQEATVGSFTPAFNQDHNSSSDHKIIFTKPSQTSKDECRSVLKVNRAKGREVGLGHLDAGQEEESGGNATSLHHTEKQAEKKRKRASEEEEEEEEKANREQGTASHIAFSCGKKVNRKNFRKAAEEEDED